MAPTTGTSTVRFHRVLRCPPERVYRAFLDPEALVKWLPPDGFTARMHQQEAVVGGAYRMSFTHFASGHTHAFGGTYLELVPHQRLRYTARFDDPQLQGEMQTTITLSPVARGTDLTVVQEGIPAAIPADDCHLGWQDSLALLARLVNEAGPA